MAKKSDDPKPIGNPMSGAAIPQHKKMAAGMPIPQGGGAGVQKKP
jgi:hypothetical protein